IAIEALVSPAACRRRISRTTPSVSFALRLLSPRGMFSVERSGPHAIGYWIFRGFRFFGRGLGPRFFGFGFVGGSEAVFSPSFTEGHVSGHSDPGAAPHSSH